MHGDNMKKSLFLISLLFLNLIIIADAQVEVVRGSGTSVVDVFSPTSIKEGEDLTLTINVKNIGDSDTFNILPTSKTGKLIITPNSASEYINAGTEKKFEFNIRVAFGKMYTGTPSDSELSAKEDIELRVTPQHNSDARVVKTYTMDISYKPIEGVTPPKTPGFQLIYAIFGITLIAFFLRKRS